MIGSAGEALESFKTDGRVRVHAESWNARTQTPLRRGQRVKVTAIDGLTLVVEPETPKEG